MFSGIISSAELFYIVDSTTPTKIIDGNARIWKITFGNPSSSANAVSFFDHTETTTSYTTGGEIIRMDAPANDMNVLKMIDLKPVIDFVVCISTSDLKGAIGTNTTSWIYINYR